jgi:hypothetical protein
MREKEEMRPVFSGYYCITEDGRLFSVRSQKFLRPAADKYGYKTGFYDAVRFLLEWSRAD